MTWLRIGPGKSGKREVAVSLLLFWAFCFSYVFFWLPGAEVETYEGLIDTLTWATFMWAAAAFGMDFAAKRGMFGASAQRQPDGPENYRGAA